MLGLICSSRGLPVEGRCTDRERTSSLLPWGSQPGQTGHPYRDMSVSVRPDMPDLSGFVRHVRLSDRCAAPLQPRKPIVERHEIMELLAQLKLAGMRAAYDEVVAAGVRAQHSFQRICGELLLAQL